MNDNDTIPVTITMHPDEPVPTDHLLRYSIYELFNRYIAVTGQQEAQELAQELVSRTTD